MPCMSACALGGHAADDVALGNQISRAAVPSFSHGLSRSPAKSSLCFTDPRTVLGMPASILESWPCLKERMSWRAIPGFPLLSSPGLSYFALQREVLKPQLRLFAPVGPVPPDQPPRLQTNKIERAAQPDLSCWPVRKSTCLLQLPARVDRCRLCQMRTLTGACVTLRYTSYV